MKGQGIDSGVVIVVLVFYGLNVFFVINAPQKRYNNNNNNNK